MPATLDLDQLRTFVAITDNGSFTRASEAVHKTQSAVSMQMRRLEERVGKPIFVRDGRLSRLTEDGERLLAHARRLLRLNDETLALFGDAELTGRVRFGTPDDYADRFLPEILARFAASNPKAEVTVVCAPTPHLVEAIDAGELDLAIVTHVRGDGTAEVVRREPLLWVGARGHCAHQLDPLPLALGRPTCDWRRAALEGLEAVGRRHRLLYVSWNSSAVAAAVIAGLAVSVLPESALRQGMRVLGTAEGLPQLPSVEIGLLMARTHPTEVVGALSGHVVSSLDNLGNGRLSGRFAELSMLT